MKCLFSVAALAVVLQSASLACAAEEAVEPTPAQVRTAAEAFDRGREAYKAEEYVEAAEQFESADANAPSAAALELAIRARDKANQLDRAATLAALALARHPDDPSIQKIAPPIVQRAKAELFQLDIKCDDPCDVTVAGKIAPGRRATDRTVYVGPGKYAVRAGWSGDRSESKSFEAAKGAATALSFHVPAESTAAPALPAGAAASTSGEATVDAGPRKSGGLPPVVFIVGAGLTAVAGGITIWSGLDTQNNPGADKVRSTCQAGNTEECQSLYQKGVDSQHRTNILLGVTAGVGVATAVIGAFFTDWSGGSKAAPEAEQARALKTKKPSFSIQPWVSVGAGASVGALGRF